LVLFMLWGFAFYDLSFSKPILLAYLALFKLSLHCSAFIMFPLHLSLAR